LAFPYLMSRFGFWLSFFMACIITIICFIIFSLLVKRFGIELL
jgi:hypothetical protein